MEVLDFFLWEVKDDGAVLGAGPVCVCVLQSVSKSAWLCIRWTNITLRASVRQTNIYSRVTVS